MLVSVVLPPSHDVVGYARLAESLGVHTLWLYDSPALYGDVWVSLARIAEATSLQLGTAVAVPSLRHPMVTASAIATIEECAPGRLKVAMGTGHTARRTLGLKPTKWRDFARIFNQIRELLRGHVVDIDGKPVSMLHGERWAPARPITTPLWIAPSGPRGFGVARELGVEDLVLTGVPEPGLRQWKSAALLVNGTVLEEGEDHTSPRVISAIGPWFAAVLHGAWHISPELVDVLPGGSVWREALMSKVPAWLVDMEVHRGHLTSVGDTDLAAIAAAGPALLDTGWTGAPATVKQKASEAHTAGITEIIYAPAGPDIEREIRRFVEAVR